MFRVLSVLVLSGFLLMVTSAQATNLTERQRDIISAAAIYTSLSFSKNNRLERRKSLPLSEQQYQRLDRLLPPRFQACMEGGFAVAFANDEQARTIRLLMQSVVSWEVKEPGNAQDVIPGFVAANKWCTSRIPLWTSAILN
ncbi:MAG: hypothetical protein L3J04_09100 [Robiginitomaculum sp.]|nr:hypothetical protein [Robiginitomaculum sp.]